MRQNYKNDIANLNKWKNNNNVMFPTFFKYQYRYFFLFQLSSGIGFIFSFRIRMVRTDPGLGGRL